MKFFLFTLLGLLLSAAPLRAAETNAPKLSLIVTKHYDPTKDPARGYSEFASTVAVGVAGIFAGNVAEKVEKEVLAKLESPEMAKYFSSAKERSQIAKRISQSTQTKFFAGGLSNSAVVLATKFTANEIMRTVIERVMQTEGVRDPAIRASWVARLTEPFNACAKAARAYSEINNCVSTYQGDLPKNLGLAMSYELAYQEVGGKYTSGFDKKYVACLKPTAANADARIMPCVLSLLRGTVTAAATDRVTVIANEQLGEGGTAIVQRTIPAFSACVAKATNKNSFRACADSLTTVAGSEVAAATIRRNDQVRRNIPSEKLINALAEQERTRFVECMDTNRTKKRRDPAGGLDTTNCASRVRFDTAKAVAYELFRKTISTNIDGTKEEKDLFGKNVYELLESCWDSDLGAEKNNACLKTTIKELVNRIAQPQLRKQLPPALLAKEPKLFDILFNQLRGCLENDLPPNLMEAQDTTEKIAGCTGALTRRASLKIAEFQLRDALFGRTKNLAVVDQLVNQLVHQEFAGCLGATPTLAVLDPCSVTLRLKAGMAVAKVLIPDEFEKFLAGHGGAKAYNLSEADKKQTIASILNDHQICLSQEPVTTSGAGADARVDECFKASVKVLATRLASMEFTRSVKEYFQDDPAGGEKMGKDFATSFSFCLEEKINKQSLKEFLGQVDSCRVQLTTEFTARVGQHQLRLALESSLPRSVPGNAEIQSKLETQLLAPFSDCVSSLPADDTASLYACANDFKLSATRDIAITAGRQKVKSVLNAEKLPPEVQAVEADLVRCVSEDRQADECAKYYARSLGKALAHLKLHPSMAQILGSAAYKVEKSKIDEFEATFQACMDQSSADPLDAAFLKTLDGCADRLQESVTAFLQQKFLAQMSNPKHSPEEAQVNRDIAQALPCFDTVLPPSPYDDRPIESLQLENFIADFGKVVGDYVSYDARKAGLDYEKVIGQLVKDLEAAGPAEARLRLVETFIREGVLDQLIKSMARGRIAADLKQLPKEEKLSPELEKSLSDPATLDKVFSPEMMTKLRPFVAENVLKPLILQGAAMSSPPVAAAMRTLETQVLNALIDSPHFGDVLVRAKVQEGINDQSSKATRFLGYVFSGYQTFDWTKARQNEAGKTAEAYIKEQILKPRMRQESVPEAEMAARRKKANELITDALKKK